MHYRPLPELVTIKQSDIEWLWLFATQDIDTWTYLWVTHLLLEGITIRTPLWWFINHSDDPNSKLNRDSLSVWDVAKIETIKDIKEWEEITLSYWFITTDWLHI